MRERTFVYSAIVLSLAILFSVGGPALAKKKSTKPEVSYDRAWSLCRDFVAESGLTWDQTQQRYARFGACMKSYDYRP